MGSEIIIFLIAAGIVALLWLLSPLWKEPARPPVAPLVIPSPRAVDVRPTIPAIRVISHHGFEQTEVDERFEVRVYGDCEYAIAKMFYAKVAGVTFPNADGTKRLPVVRACRVAEILVLVPDDSIPDHPGAVGVHRAGGGQLGYLDARLAGEVRRAGLHKYHCVFRRKLYKPDTQIVAGAVLCMCRLQEKD
jgi:hypothetical protein